MSLGENIVRLRTEKGWTQDELAERVFTSRQSVSKWETNASIPELEKLLRLSELFGVSLDELVKGTKSQTADVILDKMEHTVQEFTEKERIDESQKKPLIHTTQGVIGLLLLVFGALVLILFTVMGGFGAGLLFGAPLLGCAIICLMTKKRAGLWCGWFLYGIIHFLSLYMTGITWKMILSSWILTKVDGNPIRLIIAWVYFFFLLGMIAATLISFRGMILSDRKETRNRLIIGWTILAALVIIPFIVMRTDWYNSFYMKILEHGFQRINYPYILLSFSAQVLDAVKLILFVVLLVRTRAFLHGKKMIK